MQREWMKRGSALVEEIQKTQSDRILLWHIGQVGLIVKYRDCILMIDPMLNDLCDEDGRSLRLFSWPFEPEALKPDYVLCTHAHDDHLAQPTVKKMLEAFPDTVFLVPKGCRSIMEQLGASETQVYYLADGEQAELGELSVLAFSAAHPVHVYDPECVDMALGYQVRLGDRTLVHLGDTYLTEPLLRRLESLPSPDIICPPINGDDLFRRLTNCIGNMEAEEAAKLAVHIGAGVSIPTHFDMIRGNTVDPERFGKEMERLGAQKSSYRIPQLGEKYEL